MSSAGALVIGALLLVSGFLVLGLAGALQIYRELWQSQVIMPKPDSSCRRNSVEAVP